MPQGFQPKPENYAYDLEAALTSMVGLRAIIPADAFTAETLGTERTGNGVLIREGVVLTIGYLITEAETIWLHLADGRAVSGHVLAYDQETGFGPVQALARRKWAIQSWSQARADANIRWSRASPPSRNSPAIGNTSLTRRSSPRPRIRSGAAPR
jgi:hypothetical protein